MFDSFKHVITSYWDTLLPSQAAVLLKGLTFGIDDLKLIPSMKNDLVNTGTVHVAVVSGYNISLVINMCQRMLGNRVSVLRVSLYISVTLLYALITGFEPPVLRAWLMSSVFLIGTVVGRALHKVYVLIIASLIMIINDINTLSSYSFLLSSGATLGLFLYADQIKRCVVSFGKLLPSMFQEDLSASIAASIIVNPIIAYAFGRISPFSSLINMLVLWTIPLCTILGFFAVFTSIIDILLNTTLTPVVFFIIYPFISLFLSVIRYFGRLPWISSEVSLSISWLVVYYCILFVGTLVLSRFSKKAKGGS